jgi:cbb3-type cytochrome oxidase subunit 3
LSVRNEMILVVMFTIVLLITLGLIYRAYNRADNNKVTPFKKHQITYVKMGTFIFEDKETTKEWVEKLKNDKDLNELMRDNL